MKRWFIRLCLAGVLIALGIWGWRTFFPSPESVIRKRLGELAKAGSFSDKEGPLAKAWNVSLLADFFTQDVQVSLEVPTGRHTITGLDELLRAAAAARSAVASLTVTFPDIKVVVAPDKASAVVNLTAEGRVPGEKDFYLQELKMHMVKVKRTWLIKQIETVKTLS
jgi:hypothetical protein